MDADRNDQARHLRRLASLLRKKLVEAGGQGLNICEWGNIPHTGREKRSPWGPIAGQYRVSTSFNLVL